MTSQLTLFGARISDAFRFHCAECQKGFKTSQALSSHCVNVHGRCRPENLPLDSLPPGVLIGRLLVPPPADEMQPDPEEVPAVEEEAPSSKVTLRRGQAKRTRLGVRQKLSALDQWEGATGLGYPPSDSDRIATGTPFNVSCLYKWRKERANLKANAAEEPCHCVKSGCAT